MRENLTRFAWLAIAAAVLTIGLKTAAYFLTGSIGLLSDALESGVNLAASVFALLMLKLAAAPPDDEHAFGHDKAEFFAGGIEGALILLAAVGIFITAAPRLAAPPALEQINTGLLVSGVATLINLFVGLILLRAGRAHESLALEADGRHLLTDVWTSIGVVAGIALAAWTNWLILDPIIALLVAVHIAWAGVKLMRRSALGLMDTALAPGVQKIICGVIENYVARENIEYHALRTRQSGARKFVSVHILVPGAWTVQRGHELLERIEADIRAAVPNTVVFTHLESLDDPASWQDIELDRREQLK